MNFIIKTKHLELTDALRGYIEKRVRGIEKFAKDALELSLEVEKETLHHKKGQVFKTEAILRFPGKKLVVAASGTDLGKTITQARDELKREIKEAKLKSIELPRRQAKKSAKPRF
jgi:ribosomal subunit interface protein